MPFRKAGPLIFISGAVGFNEDGTVSEDPSEQMRKAFQHFDNALKLAGATRKDVVMFNQYCGDRAYVAEALRRRDEFFNFSLPACNIVLTDFSDPMHILEIEGVAYVGE